MKTPCFYQNTPRPATFFYHPPSLSESKLGSNPSGFPWFIGGSDHMQKPCCSSFHSKRRWLDPASCGFFFLVHSNFFWLKIASLCRSNPYMSWQNHQFQWINFHLLTLKSHFNKVIILRVQTPIVIIYHWYSASPKLPFPRAAALVGRRHALPPAPRAPRRRQGPAPGRNSCVFFWAQQVKHGANLEPHQYGHLQTEISSKTVAWRFWMALVGKSSNYINGISSSTSCLIAGTQSWLWIRLRQTLGIKNNQQRPDVQQNIGSVDF